MSKVRRLQYLNNQFMLNMPARLAREKGWRKGDYLEVVPLSARSVGIREFADGETPTDDVRIAALQGEADALYMLIRNAGAETNGAYFSWYQARLSNITARLWKLRARVQPRVAPMPLTFADT